MIQDVEVRYRRGRELDLVGSNGTRSSRVNESASPSQIEDTASPY